MQVSENVLFTTRLIRLLVILVAALAVGACNTSTGGPTYFYPDGGAPPLDGGSLWPDGGYPWPDGGVLWDGGPPWSDGGAPADGGKKGEARIKWK